jgi:ATP-binding cassette subfamily B protein
MLNLARLYIRVLKTLGSEGRLAAALACLNLVVAAAQIAEPVLFGRIIDAVSAVHGSGANSATGSATWHVVLSLVAMWVGVGLFRIACSVPVALHADRLAHRRRQYVLTQYFEHCLQLPLSFHGGAHSGRLMKVMMDGTYALWSIWLDFFRDSFSALVAVVVLLPFALWYNWRLAILMMAVCGVFGLLVLFVLRRTKGQQTLVERYFTDLAERASDALGNVALVQGFTRVDAEVREVRDVADRMLAAQIPVLTWWATVAVLSRAANLITLLPIFVVGLWLHANGHASLGEVLMFMNFAALLIGQVDRVGALVQRVFMDAPKLKEFFDVLDTEPSVHDRPDAIDPGQVRGLVEFKDVSFSYDGKRPAVVDLNFTVLPGETIALVGATGAGKSTALALLHRAFDPQSGAIKVDGMDIRGIKIAALRHNIGVVYQETLLLNRSITENLRVGKPDATEEELREACERAQALEFVDLNPNGLNASVGERGRFLSGGERQRLSIARALLKNPPILILDEATSALDVSTETKVQKALDEVMRDRTTFVIAHRLSTIRNATRILVFEGGRIIETGTFDELVRLNGRFAQYARAQFMISDPVPAIAPPAALSAEPSPAIQITPAQIAAPPAATMSDEPAQPSEPPATVEATPPAQPAANDIIATEAVVVGQEIVADEIVARDEIAVRDDVADREDIAAHDEIFERDATLTVEPTPATTEREEGEPSARARNAKHAARRGKRNGSVRRDRS